MDIKKRRKGFTLTEILLAIVVMGILIGIGLSAYSHAPNSARETQMSVDYDTYKSAFTEACSSNTDLLQCQSWCETNKVICLNAKKYSDTTYSSKVSLAKIVQKMNELLPVELQLSWDASKKAWVSTGEDPWGDKYLVTDTLWVTYDKSNRDKCIASKHRMAYGARIAVFCGSRSSALITPGYAINKDSVDYLAIAFNNGTATYYSQTKGEAITANDQNFETTLKLR